MVYDWHMGEIWTTPTAVHVGAKGRAVLPASVRRAAKIAEGDQMVAHVEGVGRIVLETTAAVEARVWSEARPQGIDPEADLRALRTEDVVISDSNFRRQKESSAKESQARSQRLLAALGL